jgi:hypothetical protein
MYETLYVYGARDGQKAWGDYGQFYKKIINEASKVNNTFFIFFGHLKRELDEAEGVWRSSVPVKGALKASGLEAYFTTVINVSKQSVKVLGANNLLHITEEEKELGFKHVFQTRTTQKTLGDRIRTPRGLFKPEELYIDNDIVPVIKRMVEYYK